MSEYKIGDEVVFKNGTITFYGVERDLFSKGEIANIRNHPFNKKILFDMVNIVYMDDIYNAKRLVITEDQIVKKL